jgi:hypothetical protein
MFPIYWGVPHFLIMTDQTFVAVLELRRLLFELKDLRPDIFIRLRLLGEMWQPNFCQVAKMTEHGVILRNSSNREFHLIKDLNNVVQFEIDSAFQAYHPHFHYAVQPIQTVPTFADTAVKNIDD